MKNDKASANVRVCPVCNKWVDASVAEACTVGTCFNPSINAKEKQFTLSDVEALVGKALRMQVEASAVAFAFSPEDSDDKYIKDSLLSVSDVMGKDDDSN